MYTEIIRIIEKYTSLFSFSLHSWCNSHVLVIYCTFPFKFRELFVFIRRRNLCDLRYQRGAKRGSSVKARLEF